MTSRNRSAASRLQHFKTSLLSQKGQSSMEYVIVCGALAFALGIGMWDDQSVLRGLLASFGVAYQKISFALSLPL